MISPLTRNSRISTQPEPARCSNALNYLEKNYLEKYGAPDRIRTCDLCLRRAALYPAELRVRARLRGPGH